MAENAWSEIKRLAGIGSKKTAKEPYRIPPNELNEFFARYEKESTNPEPLAIVQPECKNCLMESHSIR